MDPYVSRTAERFIPIAKPCLGQREAEAVAKSVEDCWISTGPRVEEFEHEFATAHGKKYGVACNSGTTALHLAMVAMDVDAATNVYMPTMTMIACGNAAMYCGNHPYFVESESTTGNIDVSKLKYREGVFVLPHLYGMPIRGTRALDASSVIEDCAECHYATFPDGSPVGSHGRFATFSFYANKIVCCGEGGIVLTDSEDDAELLKQLRSHAFTPGEHFNHQRLAFGYRMTDLQAAVGLAQHARRHEFIAKRRDLYFRYVQKLSGIPWITWARRPLGAVDWMFPAIIFPEAWEGDELPVAPFSDLPPEVNTVRDFLRWHLAAAGIETRTWFKPLHTQRHLMGQQPEGLGNYAIASSLYANGICLPIYFEMEFDDVDYICDQLVAAGERQPAVSG